MKDIQAIESGYIGEDTDDSVIGDSLTEVEIISTTGLNVIARGRRYGRYWLLKGLIPELRESLSALRRLQKEFELHSRLLHPNIVRAATLEDVPSLGICIVEEWVEGETLASLIRDGRFSKKERARILRKIISAIGYLHSVGIVHRDLKPQNIMVRNEGGEPVLIDFGFADSGDYAELKQPAGTEGYISPEQLSEGGARISDDIYSLGVIMKELCPEYSRIANRCTASIDRRPKDTSVLLRILDRADRRPKLVAWVVLAAVLAVIITATWLHMRLISTETEKAQFQIDSLTNLNSRNDAKVAELENRLFMNLAKMYVARATASLSGAERGAMIDAYKRLQEEFITFDRDRMPHFADNGEEFFDSIQSLEGRYVSIVRESYDLKRFPELADIDRDVFIGEIANIADQLFSIYYSVWQVQLEKKRVENSF